MEGITDYPGVLITVEGIDKAGKGTVVDTLKNTLQEKFEEEGIDRGVFCTKEPHDGEYGHGNDVGELLRKKLSDETVHPLALFHLFMADHYQHVKTTLIPALERGDVVICDRYTDSRYAYQSNSLDGIVDNTREWIRTVQETPNESPIPDSTIYLQISVEESLQRRGVDDVEEVFEKRKVLEAVKQNYDDFSEEFDRYTVVNGHQTKEQVKNEVIKHVMSVVESELDDAPTLT